MKASKTNKTFILLTLLSLLFTACSPAAPANDQVSTAVAQTVQAQNSLTKVAELPTFTPIPPATATAAPADPQATATTAPLASNPGCTISAELAAENPPDGVLLKPGEFFWKTWSFTNTGTCIWDTTYKLIYTEGDLMGGLTSYALPETIAPGETKDISIYLKAPDANGTYTGYWSLQTPWNYVFGIGPFNSRFYVQVSVTNDKKPLYEVTNVSYELIRDPASGCPRNVWYTVQATITTNGPAQVVYNWAQSDGNNGGPQTLDFKSAGSQTVSRQWKVGRGDSPNPRWMQILILEPRPAEFDRFIFLNNCP